MNIKKLIVLTFMVLGFVSFAFADGTKDDVEVQYRYQFDLDFQIKLTKGLKMNVGPELRFNGGYDKFLLNAGLEYKTLGCVYLGATYRMIVDREKNENSFGTSNYSSDVYHRYAFDLTYKDSFGRFTPSFRLRYNNFTDDDIDNKEFLRYRAKVDYDIRKCKISPFAYIEAYQQLYDDNMLYKMRYALGFDLKTGKKSSMAFSYKFDYFLLEYKNANVFGVGYKCKF